MDGIDILKARVKRLPRTPGVYRMLDEAGNVLYVGKAKNLKARVTSYTQPERMGGRIRKMVFETRELVVVETATEVEALLLEANLIKSLKPRYNILFRDDSSYVCVLITDEPAPQIRKHRGARKVKGEYFGPYPSAAAVYQTLDLMERAFRLRTCSPSFFKNRTRPCLKYDIKRCSAPCVGKISTEDYHQSVAQAKRFLKGERKEVLAHLQQEMAARAEAMDYEGAATVRDGIRALSAVSGSGAALTHGLAEADVFAYAEEAGRVAVQAFSYRHGQHVGNAIFYPRHKGEDAAAEVMQAFLAQHYTGRAVPKQVIINVAPAEAAMLEEALSFSAGRKIALEVPKRGDKRKILTQAEHNARQTLRRKADETADWSRQFAELQTLLALEKEIECIECYDISNIQGRQAVASQVVAGVEGMLKSRYRKYAIKGKQTPDDYAMLREVFIRRLKKGGLPEVIMVDGGKGQLNVLVGVMREAGLLGQPDCPALTAIAKGEERDKGLETIFHATEEGIKELPIAHGTPLIFVLQRIRDEAHRFAITYHRTKRAKALTKSVLDDIPGIGPRKKKALLLHFGSREAIEGAAVDDLMQAPGISRALAETVYGWFRGS